MSNSDDLYGELKGDLQTVAEPLFEFACQQVEKRGAFLPFGAKLLANGETELVAGAPDDDVTTSEAVLPLVIAALQQAASNADAVGVCEWVKIEVESGKMQDAVKTHVQHRRGLSVAFYIPATKPLLRGWQFGEMIVTPANELFPSWPVA
jgi:hypothetical protein